MAESGSLTVGELADYLKSNPGWQNIGGGFRAKHEGTFEYADSPKLQPGDEHDTTPPKSLFTDEQIAPGSDD